MPAVKKSIRLAISCFAILGIASALMIHYLPEKVRATQDSQWQQQSSATPSQSQSPIPSSPDTPAATIFVNSLEDEQANNGQCTLREALINAIANNQSGSTDCAAGNGEDTINFIPALTGTINLTTALPTITNSLTINGPGANKLTVRRNSESNFNIFRTFGLTIVTISGLTITNGNTTDVGGGIKNDSTMNVIECVITSNQAAQGGGIYNSGLLTISRSTISGNVAGDGAGLYIGTASDATVTNSTISGNIATLLTGGITNRGDLGLSNVLTLTNCTVTNNTGPSEGGMATLDNTNTSPTTTNLKNTIVANNSLPNLRRSGTNAQVGSQGNNLANDNGSGLLNGLGDLINVNPQLSALGNNGGPTQTHVLLSGSPAINAGNNVGTVLSDQRGVARPQGGTVDIGAVEVGLQFYALPAPVRLLETRAGFSGCTNPGGAIPFNQTLTLPARTPCSGLPVSALALTGNVTVVPSSPGFITLFPSSATQPTVANSNFNAGEITNNVFTVGLGASDGAVKIFASATTHVILDITGYYAPPSPSGLYFHPLPSPVRLVETRTFPGASGCILPGQKLMGTGNPNANPNLDFTVQGRSPVAFPCNSIPETAQVLVGNATTVLPSGGGYLTIYPSGAARPTVASSNYAGGDVINGPFAVRLGADGTFKVYTFATTDLVIDILGYYSPDALDVNGPGLYFNQTPRPVRLLETRATPPGLPGCIKPGLRYQSQITYSLAATNTCDGINFGPARSIVGNATVVTPDNSGFLTFFPNRQTLPTVATSNFIAGGAYNRHFFVGLDATEGKFNLFFNLGGTQFNTDLVVDVSGYFAP